jgi:5-methylcytosine-specific restriction protein A
MSLQAFRKTNLLSPMSSGIKYPCRKSGCPVLVDKSGFCDNHQAAGHEADRNRRGSSAARGYSNDWAKFRLIALKRDHFLCCECLAAGRVTPARDVHHLKKVSDHPELRLVLDNVISICQPCHAVRTGRGE